MLFFIIFIYINIYIHETGHLIFGLLAGFKVKKIKIGTGKDLFKFTIKNFRFIITNKISGGLTYIGDIDNKKYLKPRFFLFIFGGIFLQLIISTLIYFIAVFPDPIISYSNITLPQTFIYANALQIFFNIVPHYANLGGIKIPNDGLNLIKAPFFDNKEIENILSAGKIIDGVELFENKHYQEAEKIFIECMSKYPHAVLPVLNLSAVWTKLDKTVDAKNILENLLHQKIEKKYSFLLYNNIAYTYFLLNENDYFKKALEYSKLAYDSNPHSIPIKLTRGCILVETGTTKKGLDILNSCINLKKGIDNKINNASAFLYMSYGYFIDEKYEKAITYLLPFETEINNLDNDDKLLYERVIRNTKNFNR